MGIIHLGIDWTKSTHHLGIDWKILMALRLLIIICLGMCQSFWVLCASYEDSIIIIIL